MGADEAFAVGVEDVQVDIAWQHPRIGKDGNRGLGGEGRRRKIRVAGGHEQTDGKQPPAELTPHRPQTSAR